MFCSRGLLAIQRGAIIIENRSFYVKNRPSDSCMPSPLAPEPIRVQPCVWCLFWTNRNCMTVTSIFLSFASSNYRDKSLYRRYNAVHGNIYLHIGTIESFVWSSTNEISMFLILKTNIFLFSIRVSLLTKGTCAFLV